METKKQTYDIHCRSVWGASSHAEELWTLYKKEVVFDKVGILDKLIEIGLFKKQDKIRIENGNVFLLRVSNDYPVARLIKKTYGWVEYGHTWLEFVSDKLNTAGTEIEVRDKRYIEGVNWSIIGHINQKGDNTGHLNQDSIREGAIITRYRDLKQGDYR